jgi:hypothetical protein
MDQKSIFVPVIALVALTFVILLLVPFQRFKAGREGRVSVNDFKYGESANVPPHVAIPNRNLMNLLEMPLLFYVACVTLYVTQNVTRPLMLMAWIYVALRVTHSLVHVTYNKVMHRLTFYAASNVVLAIIWIRIARFLFA